MNLLNKEQVVIDPMEEDILKYFKFDTPKASWNNPMTSSDILKLIGIKYINRYHTTKAGTILKKLVGQSHQFRLDKVRGRYYTMPAKRDLSSSVNDEDKPVDVIPFEKKPYSLI